MRNILRDIIRQYWHDKDDIIARVQITKANITRHYKFNRHKVAFFLLTMEEENTKR